jgi:hypothetical protein
MSLLKHILSPFVEFEDDKKGAAATGNKPATGAPPAPVQNKPLAAEAKPVLGAEYQQPAVMPGTDAATPPPVAPAPGGPVTPLPEHQTYFEKLIEEANVKNPLFEGTDYKEFIDSKTDIDAIQDEATRYRTAFSVLKRTGLTKERLLSTGQEYINIIGRALNSYQSAYAQQYGKDVKQKEDLIQKKAAEMQALNDKINALKGDMKKLSDEISLSKSKLERSKASFLAAGETKQNEIQGELQKIEQYF